MGIDILSEEQEKILRIIANSSLASEFYFTGGTALAHFYLQHRKSEDLDFFCEHEFPPIAVLAAIKSLKNKIAYKTIDIQTKQNRNIFQFRFNSDKFLKIEFTYFPFQQVEEPKKRVGLLVDSLLDIAVNKLFTIAQNPRGRDYYDLFAIEKQENYGLEKLRMLAKQKFDWHVDPLQLAAQLARVDQLLDDPILSKSVSNKEVVDYFKSESKKFKNEILK